MKKIILITIICFSIPCFVFAQGPVTISSIEGTLWQGKINAVTVSSFPFAIERETMDMKYGFSDGMMYQCVITDGDTCTPEVVPEAVQPVIMPALGLVVLSVRDGFLGYRSITRSVCTLMPLGVGYMTGLTRAWAGEEPRAWIQSINGLLVRESDEWSP